MGLSLTLPPGFTVRVNRLCYHVTVAAYRIFKAEINTNHKGASY